MTRFITYTTRHYDKLIQAVLEHFEIVGLTLVISIALAFMIAMLVMEHKRITAWITRVFSMIYAIPSLALFALLLPVTGLGMQTAVLVLVPVFVTGGIHVDGLLDTSDALSSWQERSRRLEILKDSHAGAFAVITAAVYFIAWYGAYSQLFNGAENMRVIGILSLGFMVSRCLSGIGVITFPKAKADGTVAEFSRNSADVLSRNVLIVYLVLLAAGMILIRPVWGSLAFVGALLIFWYYHHIAMKYFGGTTGDISGFFLCICEVGMALILAVVSNF